MNQKVRVLSAIVGTVLLLTVGFMIYSFIGAIALGIFIYYSTRPMYRKLVEYGINENIAALLAQLILIVPVLLLIAYTIRILAIEVRALAIQAGSSLFGFIDEEFLRQILEQQNIFITSDFFPTRGELEDINFSEIIDSISQYIDAQTIQQVSQSISQVLIEITGSLSGIFFTLFIAFSLSFYLLRDGERLMTIILDVIDYDRVVLQYMEKLDNDLSVVFFGNILLAILTAVFAAVIFTVLSVMVPGGNILAYPALIGVLCGIGSLIPVLGMKIVYVPVVVALYGISIVQSTIPEALYFPTVFLLVTVIIIDFIPDLIARPYIGGRGGISTGLLLFSYVLGPLTLGWYGLFLGPLLFVALYEFTIIILPELLKKYNSARST